MIHPLPDELADLVEGFDHVALAVHEVADLHPLLELLGARPGDTGDDEQGGFRWVQFTVRGGKLELLQPLDPDDTDNFLVRFLASRGEGVHHLTFKVTDLPGAVARARRLGFEVVAVGDAGPSKEAFLHPRSTHGVLIQLAQWEDRPSRHDIGGPVEPAG